MTKYFTKNITKNQCIKLKGKKSFLYYYLVFRLLNITNFSFRSHLETISFRFLSKTIKERKINKIFPRTYV